jgi:hypothetical protein
VDGLACTCHAMQQHAGTIALSQQSTPDTNMERGSSNPHSGAHPKQQPLRDSRFAGACEVVDSGCSKISCRRQRMQAPVYCTSQHSVPSGASAVMTAPTALMCFGMPGVSSQLQPALHPDHRTRPQNSRATTLTACYHGSVSACQPKLDMCQAPCSSSRHLPMLCDALQCQATQARQESMLHTTAAAVAVASPRVGLIGWWL